MSGTTRLPVRWFPGRGGAALLSAALLVVVLPVAGHGSGAAAAAVGCLTGHGSYRGSIPWAQQSLDAPALADQTTGAGQTVAVLGSGVDARNAQFRPGQVLPGHDLLGTGSADDDCDGRGTVAAGLIAAQPVPTTTFAGIAPGVRIDPIRYIQATSNSGASTPADPTRLAAAIDAAVADRVTVILVVVPTVQDTATLRRAVAAAVRAGIVVVAPTSAAKGGRTYPAGYPGVLGVGAVNQSGQLETPESGPQVSLVAPGNDLVSTAPGTGVQNLWPVNLPAFAAAFAAAAAALVRAANPSMTAAEVIDRLELTASRPEPDARSDTAGWGTLNIYAALTVDLPLDAAPGSASPHAAPTTVHALPAPPPARLDAGPAPWIALALVFVGACVAAAGLARRGGGRRAGTRGAGMPANRGGRHPPAALSPAGPDRPGRPASSRRR